MLKNERVLVVEDDAQLAEVIEWHLFVAGYPVTGVDDGLAALHAFDELHPALVTIDLNVPEVSGFRLLTLFKRRAPDVPIIIVTGSTFEEVEEIAKAGANDFITKPFDPYELVQKIQYHLNQLDRRPDDFPGAPSIGERREVVTRRLA
jgi:two-component system response regulator AdeR